MTKAFHDILHRLTKNDASLSHAPSPLCLSVRPSAGHLQIGVARAGDRIHALECSTHTIEAETLTPASDRKKPRIDGVLLVSCPEIGSILSLGCRHTGRNKKNVRRESLLSTRLRPLQADPKGPNLYRRERWMEVLVRRREVETLNDLSRLCPLGTLATPRRSIRFPSPEPAAPDSWHWLPPGLFPEEWAWLDILAQLNAVRLTSRILLERVVVRVYVVPEDVRKLGVQYNKKGKEAFNRLLREVDASAEAWEGVEGSEGEFVPLVADGRAITLAQVYNTLDSPTDEPPSHEVTPHESLALDSIVRNSIPGLVSQLYPYQARTVKRMLLQEIYPPKMLDPRLIRVVGPTSASVLYLQAEEYKFWRHPIVFDAPNGGVLGEEMGSGKTCESLALILVSLDQMPANPALEVGTDLRMPKRPPRNGMRSLQDLAAEVVQAAAVPHRWRHHEMSQNCLESLERYRPSYIVPPPTLRIRARRVRTDEDGNEIQEIDLRLGTRQWLSHGTLVVVPDTLVSQWRHEITKHAQPEILRVLVISANNKRVRDSVPVLEELMKFDIVLISHTRFSREEEQIAAINRCDCSYAGRSREIICSCPPPIQYVSPLTGIHWKRLIVDEGHSMSAVHTKVTVNLNRRKTDLLTCVGGQVRSFSECGTKVDRLWHALSRSRRSVCRWSRGYTERAHRPRKAVDHDA